MQTNRFVHSIEMFIVAALLVGGAMLIMWLSSGSFSSITNSMLETTVQAKSDSVDPACYWATRYEVSCSDVKQFTKEYFELNHPEVLK